MCLVQRHNLQHILEYVDMVSINIPILQMEKLRLAT